MSINDIFRSFFGIPPRRGGRPDQGDSYPFGNNEEGEEDEMFGFRGFGNMDDVFRHFHGDMMHQMEEIQRQMEDMFQNFGSTDFPSMGPGIQDRDQAEDGNLRDKMLKPGDGNESKQRQVVPFSERPDRSQPNHPSVFGRMFNLPNWNPVKPQDKVDIDLDKDVQAGDLSKLFEKPAQSEPGHRDFQLEPHRPRASFRSVSIQKIHKPDGTVEERKTTRDSAGNEETTVTRYQGDQSHSVTTRKTSAGEEEVIENFNNGGEDLLRKDPNQRFQLPAIHPDPDDKKSDMSIFRKLFGNILPDSSR